MLKTNVKIIIPVLVVLSKLYETMMLTAATEAFLNLKKKIYEI